MATGGVAGSVRTVGVPWQGGPRPVSLDSREAGGEALPAHLVLAHGAGGNRASPFMLGAAEALAAAGVAVTLFNFPYSEAGRRMPDRQPLLLAAWEAVLADVRAHLPAGTALVAGGKSMGGRMAALSAAGGAPCAGLVYLGFPLRPPGKAGAARIEPLYELTVPQLFVQGSRDAFGSAEVLRPHLARMADARLVEVPGGDHSLGRPRRDGVPLAQTLAGVAMAVRAWLAERVLER